MRGLVTFLLAVGLLLCAVAPQGAAAAATRAEYAAQADPICNSADKDTVRLWKRFLRLNKQGKRHGAANALEAIGRRNFSANAALRPIPPPPGDEAAIDGWIDLWDQIGRKWVLAASAYRHGEFRRVSRLLNSTGPLAKRANALISHFPFRAGGEP
jgi:hypothetical protein